MPQEKSKVLAVIVHLPIDLALEIYRESGDLSISEFPSILKFAESIAEALDIGHIENGKNPKLTFFSQSEGKILASARHKQ